jgi:outer membrane protein assembly factor BamB
MRDVLVCLEAETGAEQWRVDFTERFNTPIEDFGFVCSPLVRGESVYVQTGAGFVRLDKKTGETDWLAIAQDGSDIMKSGAFSSPSFATIHGVDQLLVQGRESLYGIRESDGEVLWSVDIRTFRGMNILTPTVHGDSVFTSAYGGRGHLFEVVEQDGGFSVEETWSSRAQGYMTSPVIVGDHAYLFLRSKRFSCVDLKTGEVTWTSGPMGNTYWSLVSQGDRLLALTDAGELHLIAANPQAFEVIDTIQVSDSETWAHLAVDGDQVFVRELDGLSAFTWRSSGWR